MDVNPTLDPMEIVGERRSRWERAGLTRTQERWFNSLALVLVVLFASGWTYSISVARPGSPPLPVFASVAARVTTSPISRDAPPVAAFLVDQLVDEVASEMAPLRGESGEVNVVIQEPGDSLPLPSLPDTLPEGTALTLQSAEDGDAEHPVTASGADAIPGIWNVVVQLRDAIRPIADLNVITLVPLTERRGGRIGRYLIGSWPTERGPARPNYEVPRGMVRVTPENRGVWVSEHLQLGDFLTKGQASVWPKYVVLSPRLLDKLELTFQELERSGIPVRDVFVVSGFRTPIYNETGGSTAGRGKLSRHMYGDAADIAIDNDGNGRMDDLNGDGRITVADGRLIAEAAQRVERRHPNLIGGIGIYVPTSAHAGFVHIDARGYRARWGAW